MNEAPSPLAWHDYDVRTLRLDEADALQDFLRREWNAQHIFVRDRQLLDWQHRDERTGMYTFVAGVNRRRETIDAVLGFIPQRHFDPGLPPGELWLALWKSRIEAEAGLGTILMKYVIDEMAPDFIGALNINARVVPIYRRLGYTIGTLAQYYLVNPRFHRFNLVSGFEHSSVWQNAPQAAKVTATRHDPDSLRLAQTRFSLGFPGKSMEYLLHRYLRHPTYSYQIWELNDEEERRALLVVRACTANGSVALRVVDLLGNEQSLAGGRKFFESLMADEQAEYLDFYAYGIDEAPLSQAGFVKREAASPVVVPNLFEPFQQRNVDLIFAYRAKPGRLPRIFKGDADQDRPSQVISCAS